MVDILTVFQIFQQILPNIAVIPFRNHRSNLQINLNERLSTVLPETGYKQDNQDLSALQAGSSTISYSSELPEAALSLQWTTMSSVATAGRPTTSSRPCKIHQTRTTVIQQQVIHVSERSGTNGVVKPRINNIGMLALLHHVLEKVFDWNRYNCLVFSLHLYYCENVHTW